MFPWHHRSKVWSMCHHQRRTLYHMADCYFPWKTTQEYHSLNKISVGFISPVMYTSGTYLGGLGIYLVKLERLKALAWNGNITQVYVYLTGVGYGGLIVPFQLLYSMIILITFKGGHYRFIDMGSNPEFYSLKQWGTNYMSYETNASPTLVKVMLYLRYKGSCLFFLCHSYEFYYLSHLYPIFFWGAQRLTPFVYIKNLGFGLCLQDISANLKFCTFFSAV